MLCAGTVTQWLDVLAFTGAAFEGTLFSRLRIAIACSTIVDNRSAMGSVEFDKISQMGCGSRGSPVSPTILGRCSDTGSRNTASACAACSHQCRVAHLGTAVHPVTHRRFFRGIWFARGVELLRGGRGLARRLCGRGPWGGLACQLTDDLGDIRGADSTTSLMARCRGRWWAKIR